jgi:hypothetical protein
MTRILASLALVVLAGCARSEEAAFSSIGNESGNAVVAVRTAEGDEDELALGDWRSGLQEEQATLEFGPAGAPPEFSLRCDARRGTLLQRHGAVPAGDLPVMLVTVGSETRRFALTGAAGATPMLRATLPATDQFRPVLAAASGPITVRIGDAPPLNLPPSPLVGAYAASCANGENQRRAEVEAAANEAASANQAAPTNGAAPAAE